MTVTRWYVGNEPVVVDGHTGSYPNTTIGEEITFEFYIREDVSSEDYTYATAEDRYNRLKEYLRYSGYATAERTMGSAYFTEPFDLSSAAVDSLLVPIYPHDDIKEARGVWGVITGGDDSTEVFGAIARISLDVFVLAEYSDYSTESDVRDEFEKTL